jgi:hypothetical protein
VEAHPHADRAAGEPCACSSRRVERPGCRGKGEEERVPLGIDLDAAMCRSGFADHAAVLGESLGVPFRTKLVQQPRRTLHIGEEEGDGAAGEIVSHACSI